MKRLNAAQRAELIADAWEEHAPNDKFAGITLAQFRNATQGSVDVRTQKVAIRSQLRGSMTEAATTDANTRKVSKQVVAAMMGDPNYGSNSALYASAGFVPDSLRKSGKTNKHNGNGNGNGQPHP